MRASSDTGCVSVGVQKNYIMIISINQPLPFLAKGLQGTEVLR